MKNYLTLLSAALIILMMFSCNKEELPQEEFAHDDSIVGVWELISMTKINCEDPENSGLLNVDYGCENPDSGVCMISIYDFRSDNRVYISHTLKINGEEDGHLETDIAYKYDGNRFYLCNDNNENCSGEGTIFTIDGNTATIYPDGNGTVNGCESIHEFQRI